LPVEERRNKRRNKKRSLCFRMTELAGEGTIRDSRCSLCISERSRQHFRRRALDSNRSSADSNRS
jgi:hypothetical protein